MLETGKLLTKEARIAHRAQRVAAKSGKLDLPMLSNRDRDDSQRVMTGVQAFNQSISQSVSGNRDRDEIRSGAQSVLKSRQPPQSVNQSINSPLSSATVLLSSIQSSLHNQSIDAQSKIELIHRQVESKERERRAKTESDRLKRQSILEIEQAQSIKAANAINEQFTQIQVRNQSTNQSIDAKQLYTDIAAVYADTVAVLQSKDQSINQLTVSLVALDRESVDCINSHSHNVRSMIDLLKTHRDQFQSDCESSVQSINQSFDSARRNFIVTHEQSLDVLYDKRKTMELSRLESEIGRESQSIASLDGLRSRDAQDSYLLKQELEQSINQFSEQLEEMRNLYLFNAEKLSYHSHILYARSASHRATIEHSRQMIRTWRETCNQIVNQSISQEEKIDQENAILTQEYVALTSKLKSLQQQWAFTQKRQAQLYQSINQLHINHLMQTSRKLLHSERIIATQICGFQANNYGSKFQGREIEEIELTDLLEDVGQSISQSSEGQSNEGQSVSESQSINETQSINQSSIHQLSNETPSNDQSIEPIIPGLHTRHSKLQIERLIDLLSTECSYLVDQNAVQRMKDQSINQSIIIGDSILQACHLNDANDLDQLCSIFYTDSTDETPNIHPNDVTGIMKTWIEGKRGQSINQSSTNQSNQSINQSTSNNQSINQSINQSTDQGTTPAFWHTLGNVIPPSTITVWTMLDEYLTKYNSLLDRRAELVSQTGHMTRENEQLKTLLAQYQVASISEELLIPPTQLLTTTQNQQSSFNQTINQSMSKTMTKTIKQPIKPKRIK